MFAEQNAPSAAFTPAPGSVASGSKSTPTTPRALSILSPSASDADAHARFLREKYGIPVLMAPRDDEDDFLDAYEKALHQ